MTRSSRSLALASILAAAALFAACGSEQGATFDAPGGSSGGEGGSGEQATSGGFGGSKDGGDSPSVIALAFDPPSQTVFVDGTTPKVASFTLKATLEGGQVIDVTPESLELDRPDLAVVTNGDPVRLNVTGAFGGTGKLHAIFAGAEALAELTVKVVKKDIGAGIDADILAKLDASGLPTDPTLTTVRYPYDKTVFPLGLASPLVMWDAPKDGDVYKLHLEQANYVYDLYATVTGLGQLRAEQAVWDRITASNGGDPLVVTLSRYAKTNATAYTSATERWTIAPASLRGAIYYWTASQLNGVRQGHIARIRPGIGAVPEPLSTGQSDNCMGCHAVSADGTTLAAAVDIAPTGDPATYAFTNGWGQGRAWASFDLPSGTVRKQTKMQGSNLALTPDGKYTVFGGRGQTNQQEKDGQWEKGSKYMTLADTKTGTIVVESGLDDIVLSSPAASLGMPAFAPDGKRLAAVEFDGSKSSVRDNVLLESMSVVIFGFDQATLKFAPTVTRLPLADFAPYQPRGLGYPSFTPDTGSVAFHVGNNSTGCFTDPGGNCDDGVSHRGAIWMQKTDGVGAAVRLANLDDPPATGDRELSVEPTFNPILRGNYSWVVFTSMRDWGNKLTGPAINGKRRLWVAAIDATTGAADPSHPAFFLEGQEDSPNMRGFWTLASCTATGAPTTTDAGAPDGGATSCQAGFECCSGFCDRGTCVDVSRISCGGIGTDCGPTAACCNPSTVTCNAGKCQARVVN